jgi:hypothetical protein
MINGQLIQMHFISESINEVRVVKLFKKIGEVVSLNEPFIEVETDTATYEMPADFDGVIEEYYIKEGDIIAIHSNIGLFRPYLLINTIDSLKNQLSKMDNEVKNINAINELHFKIIKELNLPLNCDPQDILIKIQELKKSH